MMKRFVFNTILLLFLQQFNAGAQQLLLPEDAVGVAIKNNYDILLLKNDSTSYALDKSYARYAFYPRLNASTGFVFNNNNQKQSFSDGSKRERNGIQSTQLNASLQLNWTVFDGMKMYATRDKVSEFVKLGDIAIRNQLVNTAAQVLTTYYTIVNAKQQLHAIDEQISIINERIQLAEKKLQVGLGAKPDLLQSKVDLNAQRSARMQQQNQIAQWKEQLNQLLNVALQTSYEVADTIPVNTRLVLGELLSAAGSGSPALQLIAKNRDIARLTLKEREAERYPVVSFNSAYNFGNTNNKAVINQFTPLTNRNLGFNAGLAVSIPIFNNYNARRQIGQAKLDLQYLDLQLKSQQSRIEMSVINAYKNYQVQQQILKLEEENIVLARENVAISLERLRNGLSVQLELRESQKSLDDASRRLFAARFNTKIAEIELQRLKGTFLD